MHLENLRNVANQKDFIEDFGNSIFLEHVLNHFNCAWHYLKLSEKQIWELKQNEFERIARTIPNISGKFALD